MATVSQNPPLREEKNRDERKLILASRSPIRRHLLEQCGINVGVHPCDPGVEEQAKTEFMKDFEKKHCRVSMHDMATSMAFHLAQSKAAFLEGKSPSSDKMTYSMGVDQVVFLEEGETVKKRKFMDGLLHKPSSRQEAVDQLAALSGVTHHLVSAAVVMCQKKVVWEGCSHATVSFRRLTPAFQRRYLEKIPDEVLLSQGIYAIEQQGPLLIKAMEGDMYTILGLPLLAFLDFWGQVVWYEET